MEVCHMHINRFSQTLSETNLQSIIGRPRCIQVVDATYTATICICVLLSLFLYLTNLELRLLQWQESSSKLLLSHSRKV